MTSRKNATTGKSSKETSMAGFVRSIIAAIALATVTAHAAAAAPDAYPSKPVHILVPFAPGGAVDIVARTLGDELGKRWAVSIIIENRPGAGGVIASEVAAKSPPDGYTLLIAASGHAILPYLYPKLPYDIFADFTPITLLGNSPNLALVRTNSPLKSITDLIALARSKPGQLSYGHAGNGTSPHLAGELLKAMAKIDITAIPYKGGAPAINDLLGGHVPLTFNNIPEAIGQIRSGALRPLAVTTAARSPILPNVPTIAESGIAGYDTGVWWALFGPAGLPSDITARLGRDCADAMKASAVQGRFALLGATPLSSTPEELAAFIRADYVKWGPIIKSAGIAAE
jgi:tripartite-type tricarboxylate transporter receptor subunit TctC